MFKKTPLSTAVLLIAPVVNAIELTDYKDPNTAFDEAYIDFSATANSGKPDQVIYSTFLDGFFNKRYSTERQVWSLGVDANALSSCGPNDDNDSVSDFGFGVRANTDRRATFS